MKKIKFSILALIVGAICSLGLFGFSNPKIVYADEPEQVKNYYMISADENNYYMSHTTVNIGYTSGYGDFIVGAENVTISSSAYTGYQIIGWRVGRAVNVELDGELTYTSSENTSIFDENVINYLNAADDTNTYSNLYKRADDTYFVLETVILKNNHTFTTNPNAGGQTEDVNVEILFIDNNGDTKADSSIFKIERVFDDLIVDPVYDFIYYNLDITNNVDKIKLPSNSKTIGSGNEHTVYYDQETTEGEYSKLTNSIVKDSANKYYYIGDLYIKESNAYAMNQTLESTPNVEYINILNKGGAFRLNYNITFNLNIDFNAADIYNSTNIDVTGVKLNGTALTKSNASLVLNSYKITKDDTLKTTTQVEFKIEIANVTSLKNTLELVYDNLYLVSINRQIDGISSVDNAKLYTNITLDGTLFENLYVIDGLYYTKSNNEYINTVLTSEQILDLDSLTYSEINPLDYSANLYSNASVNGETIENLYEIDGEYFHILNKVRIPVSLTSAEIAALSTPTIHTFNDAKDLFNVSTLDQGASFITVQNQFAVVDSNYTLYLAKQNSGFKIICSNSYSEVSLGTRYYYYNFNTLTNSDGHNVSRTEEIYNLNSNKVVNINYSTAKYDINFKSIVNNVESNLETLETLSLNHGQSVEISDFGTNIGYMFEGYKTSVDGSINPTSINVKVSKINPTDKVIYLSYDYVDYILQIQNINSISIGTKHALSSLTLNVAGLNNFVENADLTNTAVTFSNVLNIGDMAVLKHKINNGFKFYGFSFTEGITVFENNNEIINSFELNADLIETLGGATTIVLYAYEDYIYYSLNYKIDPTIDTTIQDVDNKVIMSTISVEAPADAIVLQKNVEGEDVSLAATSDKVVATIEISNLKFTDNVILKSVPKTFTAASGEPTDYAFKYFTVDGRSHLSFGYDDTNNVYSHTEIILTDEKIVTVVYSMPITQLNISITENAYDYTVGSIVVTSTIEGETTTLDTIDAGAYVYEIVVNAVIEVYISENGVNFGYILEGFTLTDTANSNIIGTQSDYVYSFTAQSGMHNLSINFNKIKYHFIVEQTGAGLTDGTQYNFGTPENTKYYTELNIDNTVLEFNRPTGYFVKEFKINNVVYDTYKQTNTNSSADNTLYSLDFGVDFATIVGVYNAEIHSNGIQEITVSVSYEIYTYNIIVRFDSDDSFELMYIKRPTISVYSNSLPITPEYEGINPTFKNIEYGSIVEIKANGFVSQGVEVVGFAYITSPDNIIDKKELDINGVTENYYLIYKLNLIKYTVNTLYEDNKGSATKSSNRISLFQELTITAEAMRSVGYDFKSFTYLKPVYTEYTGNGVDWDEVSENLYVKVGNDYYKNIDEDYNSLTTYYTFSTEVVEFADDYVFDIYSFNLNEFAVVNQEFVINVNFKELEITFSLENENLNIKEVFDLTQMVNGKINPELKCNIDKEDYSIFTLYKNGELVDNNSTFIVSDEVKVGVEINTDASGYNLSKGLKLKNVKVENVRYLNKVYEEQIYWISFAMSDVVEYLAADTTALTLNFIYELSNQEITVTTNIKNDYLYKNNDLIIQLTVGTSSSQITEGNTELSKSGKFLKPVTIVWMFNRLKGEHLKISKFNVRDEYGNIINTENYSEYNLYFSSIIESDEAGGINYSLYFPLTNNNYIIELIIEPIILLGGTPTDELEEKIFNKDFKYSMVNNTIVAVENKLEVKLNDVNADVSIPSIINNKINIIYKQDGLAVNPINVGDYDVEIEFYEDPLDVNDDWIKYLQVTCKITLKINSAKVRLGCVQEYQVLEKEYNGTNNYDGDEKDVLKYLVILDEKGNEIIKYSSILDMMDGYYKNTDNVYYPSLKYYVYNSTTCEYELYIYTDVETWNNDCNELFIEFDNILVLNHNNLNLRITKTENSEQVAVSNASDIKYNISILNIELLNNLVNKNFTFAEGANSFLISKVIKINPKLITLITDNAKLEKKVYDGSINTKFTADSIVTLQGVVGSDDVNININKIKLTFEDGIIGTNKRVLIDPSKALEGVASANYIVGTSYIKNQSIYPYSVSTVVEGFGEVILYNPKGLTNSDKADLIPIGATLKIVAVKPDTSEFVDIYDSISKYITRTKVFVVAYKIILEVDSIAQPISNDLYLSIPYVEDIDNVLFISEENVGELSYTVNNDVVEIDLNSFEFNLDTVVVTQHQALLSLWQIALIVSGSVVIVGGTTTSIVILRLRKKRKNELLEKI